MGDLDHCVAEKQALQNKLLDAVKQCQIRFGGRTELATDGDSRVICLCTQFEAALQHGLRKNNKGLAAFKQMTEMVTGINLRNGEDEPVYWHVVKQILTKHEYERYLFLKNITTDAGRGRAWLRSALNEHALERYIHMLLGDPAFLSQYYEDWAFVTDQERSSMLPMMAAGLGSILFAINIDNADLNAIRLTVNNPLSIFNSSVVSEDPVPVVASLPKDCKLKEKKKKKKALAQIVSFDEDDLEGNTRCVQLSPSYFSAPPTCLSSPTDAEDDSKPNELNFHDAVDDYTKSEMGECDNRNKMNDNSSSWKTDDNNLPSDADCSGSCEDMQRSEIVNNKNTRLELKENINLILSSEVMKHDDMKESLSSSDKGSPASVPVINSSEKTVLTPINDISIGELIPVTGCEEMNSEDSISIPSYSEDTECTAAALALQKVLQNCTTSIQFHSEKNAINVSTSENSEFLSIGEMKQAILALMQKKEEIEEQNRSLRNLLDREMEMCSGLRVEMDDIKDKNQERVERLQAKLQALTRENELLKHQLKKYVGAVQMLKKDGMKNENSCLSGETIPAIPEQKPFIDYHFEAIEYERKLIQVAEMHGELMEFNERLHRLLSQKEAVVRRLREELIDLRGPLPDDNQTSDDDISVTSDYDASSMTAATRSLINIWIPSAFLAGKSSDSHHVYQVYIRIRDDEWNVYRRYAQFYALHKSLKKGNPVVNTFEFPPKKAIGNKDAKFVEERRKRLQHYLRCVVNVFVQHHTELGVNPDRETLVNLLPFFGEVQVGDDVRSRRNRNPFSRRQGTVQEPTAHHYTGL